MNLYHIDELTMDMKKMFNELLLDMYYLCGEDMGEEIYNTASNFIKELESDETNSTSHKFANEIYNLFSSAEYKMAVKDVSCLTFLKNEGHGLVLKSIGNKFTSSDSSSAETDMFWTRLCCLYKTAKKIRKNCCYCKECKCSCHEKSKTEVASSSSSDEKVDIMQHINSLSSVFLNSLSIKDEGMNETINGLITKIPGFLKNILENSNNSKS